MQIKTIQRITFVASLAIIASCSKFEDAKDAVANLDKQEAAEEVPECENYKNQYIQSGDSAWLDLYENNCKDNYVEANMPQDLDSTCQTEYRKLLGMADSIVLSLRGICDQTNLETKEECIQAKNLIETKAKAFQERCEIDEFYFPTPEEASIKTETIDGMCAWQAWIPEGTRLQGQDSIVKLRCTEEKPVCSKVMIRDTARIVETHLSIEGDTVYLPCAQEAGGVFAPCDFNQDRFVDPIETQKCQEKGDDMMKLCDWNADGMLDSLEKSECVIRSDSGSVNPGYYDPCDWNFDGRVDEYEADKCRNAYACTDTQTPWWDSDAGKQVCVDNEKIPECMYPTFPVYMDSRVICMDPCDMDRNGELNDEEKNNCTIHQYCGLDSTAYWDPQMQKNICIANAAIPTCEFPKKQEFLNGTVTCIDPCDHNLDGIVDDYESSVCITCQAGEFPMWDMDLGKNVCHAPVPCPENQYPLLKNGIGVCIDRCDANQDGLVDETEAGRCAQATEPNAGN